MKKTDDRFISGECKRKMKLRRKGRIGRNYSELENMPLLVAAAVLELFFCHRVT